MKDNKLTVSKLKAIEPLVEAYEFKKYNFYVFLVKPNKMNPETLVKLKAMLNECKVRHVFMMSDGEDLKIYELKAEES